MGFARETLLDGDEEALEGPLASCIFIPESVASSRVPFPELFEALLIFYQYPYSGRTVELEFDQ